MLGKMVKDIISFIIKNINDKDISIIKTLDKKNLTIAELGKAVGMAQVNLWKHLKKLSSMNIIDIPEVKRGKKKYPKLDKDSFVVKMILDEREIYSKDKSRELFYFIIV